MNNEELPEENNESNIVEELEELSSNNTFIVNICLSYRHDFGLMSDEEKRLLILECKRWMNSIISNLE